MLGYCLRSPVLQESLASDLGHKHMQIDTGTLKTLAYPFKGSLWTRINHPSFCAVFTFSME